MARGRIEHAQGVEGQLHGGANSFSKGCCQLFTLVADWARRYRCDCRSATEKEKQCKDAIF
jgi:hypothetical protein